MVQKHQVQIGAVTQLQARQLAIGDNAKLGGYRGRRVAAQGGAVTFGQLPSRRCQGELQDQLGGIREAIAHLHQRQRAGQVGDCDTKHRHPLEPLHRLQQALRIPGGLSRKQLRKVALQGRPGRRLLEDARIQ